MANNSTLKMKMLKLREILKKSEHPFQHPQARYGYI